MEWSLLSGPRLPPFLANYLVSNTMPELSIPPNALEPGSVYKFRLTAFLPSDPSVRASSSIVLSAHHRPLIASISGSGKHAISTDSPLILSASGSHDPHTAPHESQVHVATTFRVFLYCKT